MKLTQEQIKDIENHTSFSVEEEDNHYLFSCYSNAGEDFSFAVAQDDVVRNVHDYYNYFDPEEHALECVGMRGAPSIRELLNDADDLEKKLKHLSEYLESIF